MNWFEFYCGDYLRDTSELTLSQHGAYLLLMVSYYSKEKPLPADEKSLFRIAKAHSKQERSDVRLVVESFFSIGSDGLLHKNVIDENIEKAQRRIEASRLNGGRGGRPKKPTDNPTGFGDKPDGIFLGGARPNPSVTRPGEAPHAPHANDFVGKEKPDGEDLKTPTGNDRSTDGAAQPTPTALATMALIRGGCDKTRINPSHPELRRLIEAGVTPQEFEDAARIGGSKGLLYVCRMIEGQRKDAAERGAIAAAKVAQSPAHAPFKPAPVEDPLRNKLAYLRQQLEYEQITQAEHDRLAAEARSANGAAA